jgi:hypothetical protein
MALRHKPTTEERATVQGGYWKVALKLRNRVISWVLKKDFGLITISYITNILSFRAPRAFTTTSTLLWMTIRHRPTTATVQGGYWKVALKLRNRVISWFLKNDFGLMTISYITNFLSFWQNENVHQHLNLAFNDNSA